MAKNIVNVNKLQAKSKTHNIAFVRESGSTDYFRVESGSSGEFYTVTHSKDDNSPAWGCNCKWAEYQPQGSSVACSHVQKVVAYLAAEKGYTIKVRLVDEDTKHLHRKEDHINHNVKFTLRK